MKPLRVNIAFLLGKDFPFTHIPPTVGFEFLELAEVLQVPEDATHFNGPGVVLVSHAVFDYH
tara:strand:- start:128 stop:313 length:186 start_codon:yes stop_codon:yes gene_type:complete